MKKILGFDLGTGGNKASLFSETGKLLASAFVPYPTEYPAPGCHEQEPEAWYRAVAESSRRLIAESGADPDDVVGLAISGHSLGCVPIDRAGNLLRRTTPIWSDDRGTAEANRFFQNRNHDDWYRTTGCGFPPGLYTVFKILWYRRNEPEMFRQTATILGTKDYINFRLTGRRATDPSYATGTGLFRLDTGAYDSDLIDAADLDGALLPEIVPSTAVVGDLLPDAAEALGLKRAGSPIPVMAGGVDNSCMALGAGCRKDGDLYASLGSSSWIAVSGSRPLLDSRLKPYVFAHVVPGQFASAIGMFSSGTTFRWLRDRLCPDLVEKANVSGRDPYDLLTELAAESPVGAGGLLMNPSLAGPSSIDPGPLLRGAWVNLDLSHTRNDLIRSVLEGISLNTRILLDAVRSLTKTGDRIAVVGGGANSPFWTQLYADTLGLTVEKIGIGQNAAGFGAAAIAAVGSGLWSGFDQIDSALDVQRQCRPNPENVRRYEEILPRFRSAAEHLARWAEENEHGSR